MAQDVDELSRVAFRNAATIKTGDSLLGVEDSGEGEPARFKTFVNSK